MYEFFVIMQKRQDGKVYADLHKALETFFLNESDATDYMENMALPGSWQVVRLIAALPNQQEQCANLE